jgi:phosphatidylserine decarboxylase
MLEYLINLVHYWVNKALFWVKLCQNREVGWMTFDRKAGKFKREQQPLWKKFKMLVLFNPLTEWIDRTHLLRLWTHEKNLYAGEP